MISRIFHAWERRLASVTTDRVVRDFEWGTEWLPTNSYKTELAKLELDVIKQHEANHKHVETWSINAVSDSDRLFETPPTNDYSLDNNELCFPSALKTPHTTNNTVYARYHQAHQTNGPRRAVVVMPQWNADPDGHMALSQLIAKFGVSALRLSMPYHDRRMPPELHRADYIVSANIGRTLQICRQAVMDAKRAVHWLVNQGYERVGVVGTSLGSCLAMLTAAHEPQVTVAALNHISPFFADVVWEGLSTSHVRAGLDGKVELDQLRRFWLPISPQPYIERMRGKNILLVYARYDLSFPLRLSKVLIDEFRSRKIPHKTFVLPCGHYSTGIAPFSWIDGYAIIRFLKSAF